VTGFVVADLKITPREGGYARGQEGIDQILKAALSILIEHGYMALTLRRIAAECGMKPGNLSYYFKSKNDLVRQLLDSVISSYEDAFDAVMHEPGTGAEARLEQVIVLILDDITTKKSTRIFPELWALTNRDPFVQERVNDLYERARAVLNELILEMNPALPSTEREVLALFMSASMEGMTVFAGYEKPWRGQMSMIERIAMKSFVSLVRTLKPGEITGAAAGLRE
jgi:AcrR family transcriptional regulator